MIEDMGEGGLKKLVTSGDVLYGCPHEQRHSFWYKAWTHKF